MAKGKEKAEGAEGGGKSGKGGIIKIVLGAVLLLTLGGTAIVLGIASLALVAIYPFAKRFTWWPQVFLGLAFNWGVVEGASWAMDSRVPQSYPIEVAARINAIRTDMDAFSEAEQKIIERHGYGVADSAIRRYAPHLILRDAPGVDRVLTADALVFLEELQGRFSLRLNALMIARKRRQDRIDRGELPDYLAETADIRQGMWEAAPVPDALKDRRVEITGPTDPKMVINALNSGADCYMADFEDSTSPTWANACGTTLGACATTASRPPTATSSTSPRSRCSRRWTSPDHCGAPPSSRVWPTVGPPPSCT